MARQPGTEGEALRPDWQQAARDAAGITRRTHQARADELERWARLGFGPTDIRLTEDHHDFVVSLDLMRKLVPGDGWLYLPGWQPAPEWTHGGAQGLVDVRAYVDPGREGPLWAWCPLERVDPANTAGAYPFKLRVPGRGVGQWKAEEVRMWRVGHDVLAASGAEHARQGDRLGEFPP